MDQGPLIVPVTELRGNAAGILRVAARSAAPVYITQRGRLAAVLLARPVHELLRHEHDILCRLVRGELDTDSTPGMPLEEVMRHGERALEEERLAQARHLAREARRLEEREREPPERPRALTTKEFFEEMGIVPTWPGGDEWFDSLP